MRKVIFVFKCAECELTKAMFYENGATDEEVQKDYDDWLYSINKGYWEEV